MRAVKENREYTITEVDVTSFKNEGYDIYDDKGKLVAYGVGKTVAYEKYAKALAEIEALKDEIDTLKAEPEAKPQPRRKKGE